MKKPRIFLIGLLAGIVVGGIVVFLLSQRCSRGSAPPPPDTAAVILPDSSGKPVSPELPPETGEAEPTRDTTWMTDTIHVPIPLWSIQLVDYRNKTLKIAAVRPKKDSVEVYSATWYAPGGFQVREERGKIVVDTFPCLAVVEPIEKVKKKWLHWELDLGTTLADWEVAVDTNINLNIKPYLAVGVTLGPIKLWRSWLSLVPARVLLTHGTLGFSAFIRVSF